VTTFDAHTPERPQVQSLLDLRNGRRWSGCALTIGNFDGVHRGHRAILEHIRATATQHNNVAVAITFEPHPVRFFRPQAAPFRLTTPSQKLTLLRRFGVDHPLFLKFDTSVAELEPEIFVRDVLLARFDPALAVVGYDFNFGKGRRGTPELLQTLFREAGREAHLQPAVHVEGQVVSSTRVRHAVGQGDVAEARALLGRPYALVGRIAPGAGRGHVLGFPTSNLACENELWPANGIYAGYLEVAGQLWAAATNIGVRPTFGESLRIVESFVFDRRAPADLDLYGQPVALHLTHRLRDELKFDAVDDLIAAMHQDVAQCQALLDVDDPSDVVPQAHCASP
jgi:riboflavin kinase/FMN adenylyltransferase